MAEAAAQTVLDKISQGHLECPICYSRFKDPKMLDCLHSFCLNCLGKMVSKEVAESLERPKITCPVCRRETVVPEEGVQSLSSSFFLISLGDEISKQEQVLGRVPITTTTCESCQEGHEAILRCLDCKENICKKCQEAHQRLKSIRDHRIIPAKGLDKPRASPTDLTKVVVPNCRKHPEQPLCFHCETCDVVICAMCAATQHRTAEHKLNSISGAIESFRESVKKILQKFQKSKEQLALNDDSIKHAQQRLQKNVAQARSDISAKAKAEITKITEKAKLLTDKVDEISRERHRVYKNMLTQNSEKIKRTDQIVADVNYLMRRADEVELLEHRPKVMHNLEFQKELKCEPKLDMAFLGVKCRDVVSNMDLGEILLREKWGLKEKFGKEGKEEGKFKLATDIACFSNGDFVVTDTIQQQLSMFSLDGQYKKSASRGTDSNRLKAPRCVAVTNNDLLFITDKQKVKVFNNELQFVREFTTSVNDGKRLPESDLCGIAVDEQQLHVAVADRGRKVICVHNLDGTLIASTSNNAVQYNLAMSNREQLIFTNYEKRLLCVDFRGHEVFNAIPSLNGKPASPTGVLCDDDGSFYVAVHSAKVGDGEVQHYDSNGAFVATVAQGLYNPIGMTFTPSGDVAVTDKFSVKIFKRM